MKTRRSRSTLFLTELLCCIFIFTFCALVLAFVFLTSHRMALQSRDLSLALIEAQSAAESFEAASDFDGLAALLPSSHTSENTIVCYYDASFAPCPKDRAAFFLTLSCDYAAPLKTARIDVTHAANGNTVYALHAAKYHSED